MKASTKHDLLMVGIGVAVGAVALYVLQKTNVVVIQARAASRAPGFSVQGTVCPSCSTYSY